MKAFWGVVVVAVLVVGGVYFFRMRGDSAPINKNTPKQQQAPTPAPTGTKDGSDNSTSGTSGEQGNTWTGTLRISNVPAKGNLMLELADSDKIIYLNSSRDWSALIGKDVVVTFDGSPTSFTLVNIEAK